MEGVSGSGARNAGRWIAIEIERTQAMVEAGAWSSKKRGKDG